MENENVTAQLTEHFSIHAAQRIPHVVHGIHTKHSFRVSLAALEAVEAAAPVQAHLERPSPSQSPWWWWWSQRRLQRCLPQWWSREYHAGLPQPFWTRDFGLSHRVRLLDPVQSFAALQAPRHRRHHHPAHTPKVSSTDARNNSSTAKPPIDTAQCRRSECRELLAVARDLYVTKSHATQGLFSDDPTTTHMLGDQRSSVLAHTIDHLARAGWLRASMAVGTKVLDATVP